jgi:uncharacterized protein
MKKLFFLFFCIHSFVGMYAQTSDAGVPKDYNGEWINYYGSRRIKEKINYVNGHREGKWVYYYENGTIQIDAEYVKGKKEGEIHFISYYENKQVKQTWTSIHGKREGKFYNYYENGKVMTVGKYKNDLPVGKWKSYSETGAEIKN